MVRETELMINIAQSGAKTEQEKQMIRNLFIVGVNYIISTNCQMVLA